MMEKAVTVRVTGRVQGVWFRAWTAEEAKSLHLRGWVRNEADGSVLALIAGSEDALEQMLAKLNDGPPNARVDRIKTEEASPGEAPASFEIRG